MHRTNLRRVGGSVMLAVPPALLELLHLAAGDAVGMTVDQGRLVIEAQPRPRYSLDELLSQCDPTAGYSDEDRDWLESSRTGNELL